jgi:hypothetical protein
MDSAILIAPNSHRNTGERLKEISCHYSKFPGILPPWDVEENSPTESGFEVEIHCGVGVLQVPRQSGPFSHQAKPVPSADASNSPTSAMPRHDIITDDKNFHASL